MKRIPFNKPFMVGKELYYIAQSVLNGQTAGNGPFTKKCHSLLEEHLGCKRVLLTHSCTAALEMAAILCDIHDGDEVIMPSFTFVSTANTFCLRGAKPVFVDIEPISLNIDPLLIEKAITKRTKAIAPIHYAGVPCDMDAIMDIAKRHNLKVIEDAAQGLGAYHNGKALGTIGDFGALSFHETKNVISGEGGALVINDPSMAERAEIIREKGTNRSKFLRGEVDKYTWVDIGSSFLPSEIIAAFLFAQLENVSEITQKRKAAYQWYYELIEPIAQKYGFTIPANVCRERTNGHIFYIILKDHTTRENLIQFMKNEGVYPAFHYIPLHTSPMGKHYGYEPGTLPVTEFIGDCLLRLPLYYDLEKADVEFIVGLINSFFGKHHDK